MKIIDGSNIGNLILISAENSNNDDYFCKYRIVDNMPITWCYDVENNQKYCSRGFPIGCYVTKEGKRKDACVISVSCKILSWSHMLS